MVINVNTNRGYQGERVALRNRILGIDPGTATIGFGIVDKIGNNSFYYVTSGIIKTDPSMSLAGRLTVLRDDLLSIIDEYRPDTVSVESIFFFKNAKTLVPVSQARGVILEAIASRKINLAEYTPMQVKKSITGFGRAEKKLVQTMISKLLRLKDILRQDDSADALAIAVCHGRMELPYSSILRNI